jgi:hypothetical protein
VKDEPILFDVMTPLGFQVHCHESYWNNKIIVQHPVMAGRVEDVIRALSAPDEVRLSRIDSSDYQFYTTDEKRLVCAVACSTNGEGFLITAYPTDKVKEG